MKPQTVISPFFSPHFELHLCLPAVALSFLSFVDLVSSRPHFERIAIILMVSLIQVSALGRLYRRMRRATIEGPNSCTNVHGLLWKNCPQNG